MYPPGRLAGAHIHSASWGAPTSSYTSFAALVDEYTYNDEDFIKLISAGNSGFDGSNFNIMNTVGSPATAKNVITGEFNVSLFCFRHEKN